MANGSFLRVGVRLADGQKRYKNRFALANGFFPFQADAFPFQAESFLQKPSNREQTLSPYSLSAQSVIFPFAIFTLPLSRKF